MMKPYLLTSIVAALALLLSACNSTDPQAQTAEPAPMKTEAEPVAAEEPAFEEPLATPTEEIAMPEEPSTLDFTSTVEYSTAITQPEKWYRDQADMGSVDAMFKLGLMYRNGIQVTKDYEQAVDWLRKAANKDYAPAQFYLAEMYYWGWGVDRSDRNSAKWYRKAAKQGHTDSQFYTGLMLVTGKGVRMDKVEGYAWLLLAYEQGDAGAAELIEKLKTELTDEAIAKAEELSTSLLR